MLMLTSTTHKVLRGPRGGIILTNNEDLAKKFNSAIFPVLQGGPLMQWLQPKQFVLKKLCLKILKFILRM